MIEGLANAAALTAEQEQVKAASQFIDEGPDS
jgi:hypothetical protein